MKQNLLELSKTVAHALRHSPESYQLQLDKNGWIDIDLLISALANKNTKWQQLKISDIDSMVRNCEKQRFEIDENKIRARYGHSIPNKIKHLERKPETNLYHGTTPEAWLTIQHQGLLPMRRQYVHLSPTPETARKVALRRTGTPIILSINVKKATTDGVKFYFNNNVWLTDQLDSKYLKKL